jgi:hypothetical protein
VKNAIRSIRRPPARRHTGAGALCCLILALCGGGTAAAADFGLVLNAEGEYVSDAAGPGPAFTGSLSPWFSAALPGNLGLYLSGRAVFEYGVEYGREKRAWAWPPLFELERAELNFRPRETVYARLGRLHYRDSGGLIASGLFDGLHGAIGLTWARLSLGAFYTGFLYKETAEIFMTTEDRGRYIQPLKYGNSESYFASRRFFIPLDIEFPDLTSRLSLACTLLAQFDINRGPAPLHSQYLAARLGLEAADNLRLGLTAIGALTENSGAAVRSNFAGAFTADWDIPGALPDMFSVGLRWGSGAVNEWVAPFTPISGMAQGTVFTPALTGLMRAGAAYTARPHRAFSLAAEAALFWRTDVETFTDAELDGASRDRFLGTEVSGSVIWAVQSAIRLTAGAGTFFPGGAFTGAAKPRWKAGGGIMLSL